MKPLVWRGNVTGRWWASAGPDLEILAGASADGYETWREAYDATCLAIASEPA